VSGAPGRKRAEVKKALLHAGSGGVVMVVTFAGHLHAGAYGSDGAAAIVLASAPRSSYDSALLFPGNHACPLP